MASPAHRQSPAPLVDGSPPAQAPRPLAGLTSGSEIGPLGPVPSPLGPIPGARPALDPMPSAPALEEPSGAHDAHGGARKPRALVVEDDPGTRALVAHRLTRAGLDVEAVADGESALDALARAPFDLVCLDLSLPTITGFRVCEQIKRSEALRHVRVLVVSGRSSLHDRAFAREVGADGFVEKPLSLGALEEQAALLVDAARGRRAAG